MAAMFALALLLNSVHVRIDQDGGLSPTQVAAAVDQIRLIWSAAGVTVTASRPGEPVPLDRPVISLRIVRFPGPINRRGEPTLAWVAVTNDRVPAPAAFVSLPTMDGVLSHAELAGYPIDRLSDSVRAELTARAIGRAAAHEVGHYLLRRAGHRDRGLMRRSIAPDDLVGERLDSFQVVAEDRLTIVTRLAARASFPPAY